jgi:hypothetical protein
MCPKYPRAARTVILLIALTTLAPVAQAQGHTFYGSDGKAVARSTTDTQGTTTLYGAAMVASSAARRLDGPHVRLDIEIALELEQARCH